MKRTTQVVRCTQSNVREPGEIPGRLRHCNGYKFPRPLVRVAEWEGGMRFEAEVRIPVWLCSSGSGRFRGHFSVKEKDEASLSNGFRQDLLNAFILHFAEVKAFLFYIVLVVVLVIVIEDEQEGRERG